jgi:hypothetical protein
LAAPPKNGPNTWIPENWSWPANWEGGAWRSSESSMFHVLCEQCSSCHCHFGAPATEVRALNQHPRAKIGAAQQPIKNNHNGTTRASKQVQQLRVLRDRRGACDATTSTPRADHVQLGFGSARGAKKPRASKCESTTTSRIAKTPELQIDQPAHQRRFSVDKQPQVPPAGERQSPPPHPTPPHPHPRTKPFRKGKIEPI